MNKYFNRFVIFRAFGILALLGLTLGSTASGVFAAEKRSGASYTSPSFDFTLSWDETVWQGDKLKDSEGVELTSDLSYAIVQGIGNYDTDPAGCVDDSAAIVADQEDVSHLAEAPESLDRPDAPVDAAAELFTYVNPVTNGKLVLYVECRQLAVDGAILHIALFAVKSDYPDAIDSWNELLGDIDSDENSAASELSTGKIGKEASTGGIDGNVYSNASTGLFVIWDDQIWSARETQEEEGFGEGIEVQSDASVGWITGNSIGGSLETCASDLADGFGTVDAVSKLRVAPASYDLPATEDDAVGALYSYTDVTSDPAKMVAYFECRFTGIENQVVTILLIAPKASYADELSLWNDLLSGISVDLSAVASTIEDGAAQDSAGDAENEQEPAVNGTTVSGAKFGFELTYDDAVWTVDDLSDVNNDFLNLNSEVAIGNVIAFPIPYDAATCVEGLAELKQGDGVTSFEVAPDWMVRPETSRSAEGELFTYTFDGENGPVDAVTYVECRSIDGGSATLGILLTSVPILYPDALPVFEQLLAGISING